MIFIKIIGPGLGKQALIANLVGGDARVEEIGAIVVDRRVPIGERDRRIVSEHNGSKELLVAAPDVRVGDACAKEHFAPVPGPYPENGKWKNKPPLAPLDDEMGQAGRRWSDADLNLVEEAQAVDAVLIVFN